MARNATWKTELPEEFPQSLRILADIWIDFGIPTFQIGVSN
jgi:hypothetical protein